MTTQASNLTAANLVARARSEMAQGAYLAAQTSALIAIADVLVAQMPREPINRCGFGHTAETCPAIDNPDHRRAGHGGDSRDGFGV